MTMRDEVGELELRRADILEMGGTERVERQHARGKLTVRERLALLFDGGRYGRSACTRARWACTATRMTAHRPME
jgi:acetyl-CoA carboxylase carboxyltransferase component